MGRVPAEVIGEVVLSLDSGKEDERRFYRRRHEHHAEARFKHCEETGSEELTWNSGFPAPASGSQRKEMSVDLRVCCLLL